MDTTSSHWYGLQVRHWIFHPEFNNTDQVMMALNALNTKFGSSPLESAYEKLPWAKGVIPEQPSGANGDIDA